MVEKGTIVRVEYEAFADGELFDTTSADVAKKHGVHRDGISYGPLPLVVGAGRIVAGFEKALLASEVGARREVEFGPEDGFGERDPGKIQTFKLTEFQKRDVDPHPGMRVRFEERAGTVTTVTAGRVRVDFNAPMAGKKIKYGFRIVEEVTAPEERVKAILDLDYGAGKSAGFLVTVKGHSAEIVLPDACKYDPRWVSAKFLVVSDLRQFAGIATVKLVEEYAPAEPAAREGSGEPQDTPA